MASLKDFDLEHWWKLTAAAGALIAVASAPVQFAPGLLIGLGLLLFGLGEWANHPLRTGVGQGFTITGYPWGPNAFGLVLDAIGVCLFALGLYRLI